jgi:hypothetical protein
VLTQRERDVVLDRHRAEEGAVLEEDAELLADLEELFLLERRDVVVADVDVAGRGLQESDEVLEEDGLPGSGRAEDDRDLTLGDIEGDVFPDRLGAEALRQSDNGDRSVFSH